MVARRCAPSRRAPTAAQCGARSGTSATASDRRTPGGSTRMSTAEASGLNASVLVLNRHYMAVHVVNVRRAFGLLVNRLAEVIHIEDGQYANYDFDSWREMSEAARLVQGALAPRGLDSQRQLRDLRAARAAAAALRSPAQAARAAEPAQHLRPRRQPVPVLRQAVRHQRAEPRPHRCPPAAAATRAGRTWCAPA